MSNYYLHAMKNDFYYQMKSEIFLQSLFMLLYLDIHQFKNKFIKKKKIKISGIYLNFGAGE